MKKITKYSVSRKMFEETFKQVSEDLKINEEDDLNLWSGSHVKEYVHEVVEALRITLFYRKA